MTRAAAPAPPSRLIGAMLAGALLVPLLAVALAALIAALRPAPEAEPGFLRVLFTRALSPTGWIGLPVLGAGLGALAALGWSGGGWRAARTLALAVGLAVLGAFLVTRPPAELPGRGGAPRTARAKSRAILRAAFRSPATLESVLQYTRDPDPVVREQAVLALGVNLVVAGIEGAPEDRPSPYARHRLRDSLEVRLSAALTDPNEAVRAEAARAVESAARVRNPQRCRRHTGRGAGPGAGAGRGRAPGLARARRRGRASAPAARARRGPVRRRHARLGPGAGGTAGRAALSADSSIRRPFCLDVTALTEARPSSDAPGMPPLRADRDTLLTTLGGRHRPDRPTRPHGTPPGGVRQRAS